jgi:nicotinate-nucleotide pyrophosphorylase (carboxylating)
MTFTEPWLDDDLIARVLAEDIGRGDVTTLACVPAEAQSAGTIVVREAGVPAGLPVAMAVFRQIDPTLSLQPLGEDGIPLEAGKGVLRIAGAARSILMGERVALNFVARLSGIATLTAQCVKATEGTQARIVDTRKTTPGLRALEKYAVRMGGGGNHRFGLDDGILIKDNHIAASGGILNAVHNARKHAHLLLYLEVECETIEQVHEALICGVHCILLDNMTPEQLRTAVSIIRERRHETLIEASGNIGTDPEKIRAVAETGVDLISIGALTHSAPALDVGLDFEG